MNLIELPKSNHIIIVIFLLKAKRYFKAPIIYVRPHYVPKYNKGHVLKAKTPKKVFLTFRQT